MNDSKVTDATDAPRPEFQTGLVEALTGAYAALLKTQRTASSAYVRWTTANKRSHEFSWLEAGNETLLTGNGSLAIPSDSGIHASVQKMMATLKLNPYERELQYGYPYVVGQSQGVVYRAPLLTIPVSITAEGGNLCVSISEDTPRFNSLPFRSEHDPEAREQALAGLIEKALDLPLTESALRSFCDSVVRELRVVCNATLDGALTSPPRMPTGASPLKILDVGALFIAPKTSYFLVSDLEAIGKANIDDVARSSLGWMIGKRPPEPTSDAFSRNAKTFFPFSSNPSQRHVAHLVDDPKSRITVVQGPPGTGKSLTIANLACHLVAQGKKVLITSQKDKALQVVDELLRGLEMAQLPMTLLRRDKDSKKQLSDRLESIQKERSTDETRIALEHQQQQHQSVVDARLAAEETLKSALIAENVIAKADLDVLNARGVFSRMWAGLKLKRHIQRTERHAKVRSDAVGEALGNLREALKDKATCLLRDSADHRVSTANKTERLQLREFAKLLGRNETNARNFRIFDKLKSEPERCAMLLKILPCWIVSPDDVARLFPCTPGLFDVVIIDEASQCDLPSMTPVLFRATQAVVAGDSRQMQAQRFAFTAGQVAAQAWAQFGLDAHDPNRWFNPATVDLLQLASIRMDEEAYLNEHYRSVPDIIDFSNHRWYRDELRIMRDAEDRRHGDPDTPAVSLHRVEGRVKPGAQENEREARALVDHLKKLLLHPAYSQASFGVICLFEQQMQLVNEMVADEVGDEIATAHQLVVVNPDGFQGDERDVILYSLSYDGNGMTRDQLSSRQADRPHIQGMLNVAFTRPRDEMHIFHSADIKDFGMADGKGPIKDWLDHCSGLKEKRGPQDRSLQAQMAKADSGFEQQVMTALAGVEGRVVKVRAQYPCCGYFIDIIASEGDNRIAIECDGEWVHLDEHGELKIEDIERQEVLERAGWRVLRIPYRSWREDPESQVSRVLAALEAPETSDLDPDPSLPQESDNAQPKVSPETKPRVAVNRTELAIVVALRSGVSARDAVYRHARATLGNGRLGSRIKASLDSATAALAARGVIRIEEDELFFSNGDMRTSRFEIPARPSSKTYSEKR